MPYGAKIAKNAAWLMFATAGQKLVAFFAFIIVARLLGKELTGVFFYAVSVTSIFVILSDLGMTPVVIRAIAGGRTDGARLFGAAIRAKLCLAPIAIIAALVYALAFGADKTTLITVAIACLVMTADTVHLVLYGALRGRQNLRPEALGMFVGQILTAIFSVGAAVLGFGPIGLAVALLVGSSWNVFWSARQTVKLKVPIETPLLKDYKRLAKEALPFGIAGLSVKVYSYVDSLFLNVYHGSAAVGLYAVAYKLTYALQFLPITFTAALYPALASAYAKKEKDELRNIFLGSLRLMAAIGFPISAGLSALAPDIIPLLYGQDFVGAIAAFQILPWVLLPIFLDFPIGALLNGTNRAHLKTIAMVVTMIVNIVLNAILVPKFGPVGAAWAGVASFWCLYLIGAYFTREYAGGVIGFVSITLRGLAAAGVSWYAWQTSVVYMPLFASMVFGAAVALIMGFVVRFIRWDDMKLIVDIFRKTKNVGPRTSGAGP
ncbi:MAG: flippase [Patescibacteria group bacterium]|nr:flippase [Patescibacteria group bacterium]